LVLPTLFPGCETWKVREEDKSGMTSAQIQFMRRVANTHSKITKPILPEFKINPAAIKIQNAEINEYSVFGEWQRQTGTYNYMLMKQTKPRTTLQKTYRLLMGPEQVTWPKPLQVNMMM
jgi:hypothetical protein